MPSRAAVIAGNEVIDGAGSGALGRIILVADDYEFLDTVQLGRSVVPCECVIPRTREDFVALTEPPPLAVVVDLDARTLDPLEILYILGALSLSTTRVVLLQGKDPKSLAQARSIGATVSLDIAGTLARPLSMDAVYKLLARRDQAEIVIGVEELRTALREQQFLVHYQPIVASDGQRWSIRTLEALVRWQHPRHGRLFPGQFLGAVRSARLTSALTDFVLTEAIQQAGVWRAQGCGVGVAVNLEPRLIRDLEFAERLMRLLRQHEVPAGQFALDVVESASARDREMLADAMARVRAHGIGLSLDDFGTGNSSLMELHRLPFTELKIHRSLIREVPASAKAATIVCGIIELAHRLSMSVCAEGVETADTFAFLQAAGCDAMQGIFIARPASAGSVQELERQWAAREPRRA